MNGNVILAARRTAVVPRKGAFAELSLHGMAAPVIRALLADSKVPPEAIGEVIVSNALGAGGNPARSVALAAGLPEQVAGLSIDRQCAGGLDAILLADAMIRSGLHEFVIAGGVESYSRQPIRMQTFADGRPPEPYDQAPFTPWPDRDPDMAEAADTLARTLGISDTEQAEWAMASHAAAMAAPSMAGIVPVNGVTRDPFARRLTQRHCRMAAKVSGGITAATMAVAADGAAFVLLASEQAARRFDRALGVRVGSGATLGGDPALPGLAPVVAIKTVLDSEGLNPEAIARAEIMEAFAVQAIACQRGANLPRAAVNPDGGALARGHPVGASGAVLAVDLAHGLKGSGQNGLAAIAAAGGLGSALILRG